MCGWRVEEGEGEGERETERDERKGKDRQAGRQRQASDQMRSAGQVGSLHGRSTSYWVVRAADQQRAHRQDRESATVRTDRPQTRGQLSHRRACTGYDRQATGYVQYRHGGREGGSMSVINRRIPGRVPSLTRSPRPQGATARYAPHGSCRCLSTMRPLYLAARRRLGGCPGRA